MTKPLTKAEKKQKKEVRKQQKAASKTVKTITQPKPAAPEAQPVNLCDDCAYEYGECEGKPKFASDQDETLTGAEADRVVACEAFLNVAEMPTADQASKEAAAQEPAAAEGEARVCDIEHLGNYPDCFRDCPKDECDGKPAAAESEEAAEPEVQVIRADLPERPDPKRFQVEEDFGNCQSCSRPLKRTALNRYQDAVRCTNGRCRAYRVIVKTVSTGVK